VSIVNRLYKVLRARLEADDSLGEKFADVRRRFSAKEAYDYTDSESAAESEASSNSSTNQDPELAKYYANLEIPYGSDLETVKKAWKKLLQKYHPDLHSDDPQRKQIAHELTQGLNQAYTQIRKRLT